MERTKWEQICQVGVGHSIEEATRMLREDWKLPLDYKLRVTKAGDMFALNFDLYRVNLQVSELGTVDLISIG